MPMYAALIYGDAETEGQGTPEQWQTIMDEYRDFDQRARAAGVVAGGEALEATSTATTIRIQGGRGGELLTTDGPFAETKEVLGGFYLFDCADLDEALKWAAQIPGAWYGTIEVRPVVDFSDGEGM